MNYSQYYYSNIKDKKGLKPVYGATGLGKTYGIKEVIKRIQKENPSQKFIYITNRHALIQELEKDLKNENYNINTSYLKGNNDVLRELFINKELQEIINTLIQNDFFEDNLFIKNSDKETLKQYFNNKIEILNRFKTDLDGSSSISNRQLIEKEVERVYSQIGKDIKNQFFIVKHKNNKQLDFFLNSESIWKLFPYIKFEYDTTCSVLLGTIQKFCRGFFNGKRDFKLHDLEHKNKEENFIIFLDEFDFLESEILNILSEEPQLQNSIDFVRFFMEDFEDWKENEFWEKDDDLKFVKQQMQKTYDYVNQQIKTHNFQFPRIRKFIFRNSTFNEGDKKRFVLFQNNNTILSEKFYLKQPVEGKKYFDIIGQEDENTVNTYAFFGMIKSATEQLLRTFDSVRDRGLVMKQLIHEIWNTKNDNTEGEYHNYISENYTYRNIKSINKKTDEFSYQSGFSLITIKKENNLDPELAQVEQLELITSPESIIGELASKNLVFALSATTDLNRMVQSFNMEWFRENTNFIEPSKEDRKLITLLKKEKYLARTGKITAKEIDRLQNIEAIDELEDALSKFDLSETNELINFQTNNPIDRKHFLYKIIQDLKKNRFYEDKGKTNNEKSQSNRMDASLIFFGCLDWIINESTNRTHLIFSNSFRRQIMFFEENSSEDDLNLKFTKIFRKRLVMKGFIVEKIDIGYKLIYNNKIVTLIFLNSAKNKELGEYLIEHKEYSPKYDSLFLNKENEKVILVTQYATASNGLNLRCLDTENNEIDFEGIHLLEPKYFWLDTQQENVKEKLNNKKKAFWYWWKLYKNTEIGFRDFRASLKETNLTQFNNKYKNTNEFILNQIALFHQALGRVDRKKINMPSIEVTLGIEVKNIFLDFLTQHKEIAKNREKYTADFILQLHAKILEKSRREQIQAEISASHSIARENLESKEQISFFLQRIRQLNKGEYNQTESEDIINIWQQIREGVLMQDTSVAIKVNNLSIDFKDLTFETLFLQENTLFYSVSEQKVYPKEYRIEDKIIQWDLDNPFYYVNQNELLRQKFKELNYPLSYIKSSYSKQRIFTPYIEQAILRGAIGEECIKILLSQKNLFCEEETISYPILFELFDAKLKNKEIYFDFKNFSKKTQDLFLLDEDDFFYEESFDSKIFLEKVNSKLTQIIKTTGKEDSKYIVINFISNEDNITHYFDINLNKVNHFTDCKIAVVPSSITFENPNQLSKEFEKIVVSLQNFK